MWYDESKACLFDSAGTRQYVRRPPRTANNPQYTLQTVKHGGKSIFWAISRTMELGLYFGVKVLWINTSTKIFFKVHMQNTPTLSAKYTYAE